jgi:hypothetical protein
LENIIEKKDLVNIAVKKINKDVEILEKVLHGDRIPGLREFIEKFGDHENS